ncbi:unnamed protein product [Onchocerca flexuosa]|uniref:DB domain-containing protein n=1 Tax=Onchocerca flexuosa TaxID=387005 RepID=A0A183I3Z6_9BILA|nr:unnamed protein product [Onchocerca flexuosa]
MPLAIDSESESSSTSGGYGCPQPVVPACSGGCVPGYGCGQYGCYSRARARSSKILDDGAIYLHFDRCPLSALTDISYCAAAGTDHTECCVRNDVTTTLAGRKCLIFCDQRPGNVTQLDLSYLPCYDRFENIKLCFMEHISSRNKPDIVDVRLARTFET